MTDADDIALFGDLLSAAKITMERVPESLVRGENRCDLHAHDAGERYLFEVKALHEESAMKQVLSTEGVYTAHKPINDSNQITVILDKAVKQLRMTVAGRHDGLRLAVLIGRGSLSNRVMQDRVFSALYGLRTIGEVKVNAVAEKCLYFSHSVFFRHRTELDGAIIMDDSGVGMCLNDFGPRTQRVRESQLGRFFADAKLLHDAAKIERDGHYLIADCDIDRNNEHAVLGYLATKYNLLRPIVIKSYGFVGAASLKPINPRGSEK
jgi:hypothetical protein